MRHGKTLNDGMFRLHERFLISYNEKHLSIRYFFDKDRSVENKNRKSMELLDLISQQNCAVQEENASKTTTIKTLVENQAAITQALNEVKNEIVQEFHKIKSTKIMNLRQKVTKK